MSHPKGWANGRTLDEPKKRERLKIFLRVKHGELQQTKIAALFPWIIVISCTILSAGRSWSGPSTRSTNNRIELLCGVVQSTLSTALSRPRATLEVRNGARVRSRFYCMPQHKAVYLLISASKALAYSWPRLREPWE